MRRRLSCSLVLVGGASILGCSAEGPDTEDVAQGVQALSGAQALEFESTSPWSPGGTQLSASTTHTQGNHSLQVQTTNSYQEVVADDLSSVGSVGDKLAVDLRLDQVPGWGGLRAILRIPSQGVYWADLGEVSFSGMSPDQFTRVEYTLWPELQTKLAGTYSDLEIRWVFNGPSNIYHLDNGSFGSGAPPSGPQSADVGSTGTPGSSVLSGGTYTIQGAGGDIGGTADGFQFLYQSLTGDGQIVARIVDVTETDPWTKVGVMVRDDLAADARNAFMLLRPSQGSAFQARTLDGASTSSTWQEDPNDWSPERLVRYLRPAKWLKLTREGDVVTAYSSDDGSCWQQRWKQAVPFEDSEAFFGVALTSHSFGNLATATVTDFSVQNQVEPINQACDRAAVDGDLPLPTSWIAPPARFGTSTWSYTTTNPNGASSVVKCDPSAVDEYPDTPEDRTDGPDHPNCPDPEQSPPWTQLGFNYNTPGWQMNQPAGFGSNEVVEGDTLSTVNNSRGIWLRKDFSLSNQNEVDNLMFWGRWSEGVTIYVNGVLATSNSAGTGEYRYLGLSDEARAALNVGSNVVAVRLEWEQYAWNASQQVIQVDAWDKFFDLGLTLQEDLASLPVQAMPVANPALEAYTETMREFMQEQGMSGGALAVVKDGETVVSSSFGYFDKNLTTPMPLGAIMRLASNDKLVTQAAIVDLIEKNELTPETKVFDVLDLDPVPGQSPGANVHDITVEHLRLHTSGIGGSAGGDQAGMDEMAFKFGITTAQWNKHYLARWLYSQPAVDMGLDGILVSAERLAGRQANEPGYITREQPWDRWLGLEDYLALSASAEGMA